MKETAGGGVGEARSETKKQEAKGHVWEKTRVFVSRKIFEGKLKKSSYFFGRESERPFIHES